MFDTVTTEGVFTNLLILNFVSELFVSQLRVAEYIVDSDPVKRSVFFFSFRHFFVAHLRVSLA
jgi:hypothetical protein